MRTLHLIAPFKCVSNLGATTQVNMRTQEVNNCNKLIAQETRRFYPMVRPMPTPCCSDLLRSRFGLNPSQVIQRSNLSTKVIFLISNLLCERLQLMDIPHKGEETWFLNSLTLTPLSQHILESLLFWRVRLAKVHFVLTVFEPMLL